MTSVCVMRELVVAESAYERVERVGDAEKRIASDDGERLGVEWL